MRIALALLLTAAVLSPLTADAIDVSGDQWGTWTRDNSPYNVIGEIRVPPESTLVIQPGVVVNFQGHYKFIVDSLATLLAVGTEADSIYFMTEDNATGWHGIRFLHADGNSQISYTRLQHGKATGDGHDRYGGAIYCSYSSPTISDNAIIGNYASAYGGGIHCYYCSPTIANNIISLDSAGFGGGGIACSYSSPTISNNHIAGNWSPHGGGIRCWNSSPWIRLNTISDNSALGNGGGIDSYYRSSPRIRRNTISGDSAGRKGAGIHCRFSHANIRENSISSNWAVYGGGIFCTECQPLIRENSIGSNWAEYGGGIFCTECQPVIRENTVRGNSAREGGGICCWDSNPTIHYNVISSNWSDSIGGGIACNKGSKFTVRAPVNNCISGNSAGRKGGGVYCSYNCSPTIVNTILWDNTAPQGAEIYLEWGSNASVIYCDVQGGWPGVGNIDADPLFAGPYDGDLHLRWHSPCIDAGDPDSPLDPDGTRSDMGALYFDQAVPGIVELYPHNTPIVIPPEGGDLAYDGWIFNFLGQPGRADVWTYALVPGMGRYGPINLYQNLSIGPDSLGMNGIRQHISGGAPAANYLFVACIGEYPDAVVDSSYFYFTKSGSGGSTGEDWLTSAGWFKEPHLEEVISPVTCALNQNYPNPFNSQTLIAYAIPEERGVSLTVYNIVGEKVRTLVDARMTAGYYTAIWDGRNDAGEIVSSGIYVYRLKAGNEESVRRMSLLR